MTRDSEQDRYLQSLERKVRSGRRNSLWLAVGAAAALLLSVGAWLLYYQATVLSLAQLDDSMRLERNPTDPSRLTISYRPRTAGTVSFRRADAGRETELFDRAAASDEQKFEWRWTGVKPGDQLTVTYRQGWRKVSKALTVPKAPRPPALGDAVLAGEVVDATTNKPLAGAEIRLVGTRLSTRTGEDGRFRLANAPAGPTGVEISAPNFETDQSEHDLVAGGETPLRVALSPGLEAGKIRLVLTWGKEPADLDAHLEGPLPDGSRFQVFHKAKGDLASREFVSLDVDDRDGEGPETITVLGVTPGTYHFFVHNSTSGGSADALARSSAEVKLYQGGQTYRFHADNQSPGDIWQVCDIEVTAAGAVVHRLDKYGIATAEQQTLYSKRTQGNRGQWIVEYGGTSSSEAVVQEGLDWLARHQAQDGHWGPTCLNLQPDGRCEASGICSQPGGQYDMALTGLPILAYQAGGHFAFNQKKYSETVRRGLDWLVAKQRADGALVCPSQEARHSCYMYEHGIATFALADACAVAVDAGVQPDDRYLKAAEKAVRFIEMQQHTDGGWRYTESVSEMSDTSVTGWQLLALKSAKEAHIAVNPQCLERVAAFFKTCEIADTGRTAYTPDGSVISDATTGVGMLVHEMVLDTPDSPLVQGGSSYLAGLAGAPQLAGTTLPGDFYTCYNCTLAMFLAGGDNWKRWNDVVRDGISSLQIKGNTCSRGSWDPQVASWPDTAGGRVYSTALAVLTLEVYYRYNSERAKVYQAVAQP